MIQSKAFIEFINNAPGISPAEAEELLYTFRHVTVNNKGYFLKEGEVCNQIGYVDQGCLSYYRLLESGKKSIVQFAFEDWWIGDLDSFFNRTPTTYYWQALEPVELICINREEFDKWMNRSEVFRTVFMGKTQKAYIKALDRASKDKAESAEEKYLRMLVEYPQIIQRVPHYDVASYLGITPESLSRIRNKISRNR